MRVMHVTIHCNTPAYLVPLDLGGPAPPPLCRGAAAADGEHLQAALQGGLADVAADKAVAAKDDQAGSAVIRL